MKGDRRMQLIGNGVIHKVFGFGEIVEQSDENIKIKFNDIYGTKMFQYPTAFENYLSIQNFSLQAMIDEEIKVFKENLKKDKQEKLNNIHVQEIEKKKVKTTSKKHLDRNNIAIKCNYCNGGETDTLLGYRKPCSDKLIQYNIEHVKRDWCSQEECPCNQYYSGKITREELDKQCNGEGYVCYESQMMRNWVVMAGFNNNGVRKGESRKFREISRNMVAILTTRTKDMREEDRIIFAVFLVSNAYKGDEEQEGKLTADPYYRIELSKVEAERMKFWKYYYNPQKPDVIRMGSGLYRYLRDEQALQILNDIYDIKSDQSEKEFVKNMIDHICNIKNINIESVSLPNGALVRINNKFSE